MAKELHDAQKLIGKKVIGIPGKDSTPEEQRAFHAARGVPETADGYDLSSVVEELKQNAPDGWEYSADREKQFKEWAKGANLAPGEAAELARRVLTSEMESGREALKAAGEADKKTEDMVAEKWGPDREAKQAAANVFARHIGFGDAEVAAFLKQAGTNPEVRFNLINFFADQGALLAEGGGPTPPGGDPMGGMSPEQATIAKDQYLAQGDNRLAYMDSSHPRNKEVEAHMTKLIKIERGIK